MDLFILSLFILLMFDAWIYIYKLDVHDTDFSKIKPEDFWKAIDAPPPVRDVVVKRTELLLMFFMNIGVCFLAYFVFLA